MIKKGSTNVIKIYKGSTEIQKVYKGSTSIYEASGGYTPLNYIQSTGSQYIQLDIAGSGDMKVEFQYSGFEATLSPGGVMFGCYGASWTDNSYGLYANYTGSRENMWMHYCSNRQVLPYGTRTPTSAVVIMDKGSVYINGTLEEYVEDQEFTSPRNIRIFTGNGGFNGADQKVKMKLNYFKIWVDDVLVRDLIPVLDSNNEPCLYDKLTKKFYYNGGTGSLLYG